MTEPNTMQDNLIFLKELQDLLETRKSQMPEGSYTSKLFASGIDKIAQKVGEEAIETVIAAKNNSTDELVYESADLIYHLIVLLQNQGITIDQIVDELATRHNKEK